MRREMISRVKLSGSRIHSPDRCTYGQPGAFTLLELLVVVAIISILAGLVIGTAGFIQRKSAMARAEAEIAALSAALENYKAENGDYPITTNANPETNTAPPSNTVLSTALMPTSGKVYFEFPKSMITTNSNVIDPFGENYGYRYPGTNNGSNFFDLWSRAGSTNTNVWIKNW